MVFTPCVSICLTFAVRVYYMCLYQNFVASWLTTKLSGWALRIKPGPSQPCFCIVIATENNLSNCSLCYFDFILLFQLLQRYCLYFSKGFWPILQDAEKWPQRKNLTPTFRENDMTIKNAGGGIGESEDTEEALPPENHRYLFQV